MNIQSEYAIIHKNKTGDKLIIDYVKNNTEFINAVKKTLDNIRKIFEPPSKYYIY